MQTIVEDKDQREWPSFAGLRFADYEPPRAELSYREAGTPGRLQVGWGRAPGWTFMSLALAGMWVTGVARSIAEQGLEMPLLVFLLLGLLPIYAAYRAWKDDRGLRIEHYTLVAEGGESVRLAPTDIAYLKVIRAHISESQGNDRVEWRVQARLSDGSLQAIAYELPTEDAARYLVQRLEAFVPTRTRAERERSADHELHRSWLTGTEHDKHEDKREDELDA